MKNGLIRFAVFISSLIAIFIIARLTSVSAYIEAERLREWFEGFGACAPLLYILIYAIAPSLMLPGLPLTVAGGLVFGPVWGLVYVMIGSTCG
ncbi:MAG: hypothetical protein HY880_04310, partial [Deltaproteobacteria bacterium]|nr:hypothetical protein [Deltaproteobacteria bacterium]